MISKYHEEQLETAPRDELRRIQSERLRAVVRYVYDRNPVQRERFGKAGIIPHDIRGLEDLRRLPMMDKRDFQQNYPLGLSCVPKNEIVQMHMSSGSTGAPIVMPYTQSDLHQWATCMARCLRMAGAEPADTIQITPMFGLFNGGFGFYHGAELLGLFVLPTGAGNTLRQVRIAKDFGTRIIAGVVSYGIRLMEALEEQGETLPDLEIGIFGAEPFSDALKNKLAEGLGVDVFDIYGTTETGGVGTLGMDCPAHQGIHVWEDHYIIEVIDPATGEPVEDGSDGELVATALTREALPAIRFRTGDITRVVSRDRCDCGRTHVRIAPIAGRADERLAIKGVTFFPTEIEEVLLETPGVGSNYQIVIEDADGLKEITVNVEMEHEKNKTKVANHLRDRFGLSFKVEAFPPGGLSRPEGIKVQRVVHRKRDS
ncbi:MAG: AMP-binding protein [Candidatus Hydrogenedentes bacterium]|nr:AMP-binding protein [Candidatus Hydrogenedentota bacterium]